MLRERVPVVFTPRIYFGLVSVAGAFMLGAALVAKRASDPDDIFLSRVLLVAAVGPLAFLYLRFARSFTAKRTPPRA